MAKVLLIDDDEDLLATARQWFSHEKHDLKTAANGASGWNLLRQGEFDVVILDWDLPDINGIDILQRFRGEGGSTPVIMLTGRASVDSRSEGLDSGADDYLTKPFHMKELFSRIRALLRRAGTQVKPGKPLGEGNEEVLARANLSGSSLASFRPNPV